MERGKEVCRILKDVRRQIAAENGIEFVTSECTHKGDCAGTCPKCEAEVRYLESQLARRRASGRSTRLTGISVGLVAVAPALLASCDVKGDMVISGDVTPPLEGDPALPTDICLGENLVFDLITYDAFMETFAAGGWVEMEVYDVYPGGGMGEEILSRIVGYTPIRFAVKGSEIKMYHSYDSEPDRYDFSMVPFVYDEYANRLEIGTYTFTVASITEEEMVCYGQVFSQKWAPEAFLGKYVFHHLSDDQVAEMDERHAQSI